MMEALVGIADEIERMGQFSIEYDQIKFTGRALAGVAGFLQQHILPEVYTVPSTPIQLLSLLKTLRGAPFHRHSCQRCWGALSHQITVINHHVGHSVHNANMFASLRPKKRTRTRPPAACLNRGGFLSELERGVEIY